MFSNIKTTVLAGIALALTAKAASGEKFTAVVKVHYDFSATACDIHPM